MPPGPFAQACVANGMVYVAGQVGFSPEGGGPISDDVGEQTAQAIANLRTVLEAAGARLEDVVKLTCILPCLEDDYAKFNEAFSKEFGNSFPARTTVAAGLLGGYHVEIEAVAFLSSGQ
jgi:2-iminobutanoate/2-iminopropanoate deaminase